MKRSVALCLFGLMAGTAHSEQWFMVQSPVSVSVDTASIEILLAGQRRARVKHDMSLAPPEPKEPGQSRALLHHDDDLRLQEAGIPSRGGRSSLGGWHRASVGAIQSAGDLA